MLSVILLMKEMSDSLNHCIFELMSCQARFENSDITDAMSNAFSKQLKGFCMYTTV